METQTQTESQALADARTEHAEATTAYEEVSAKLAQLESDLEEASAKLAKLDNGEAYDVPQATYTATANKVSYLESAITGAREAEVKAKQRTAASMATLASIEVSEKASALATPGLKDAKRKLAEAAREVASIIDNYNAERSRLARQLEKAGAIDGEINPFAPAHVRPKRNIGGHETLTINGEEVPIYGAEVTVQSVIDNELGA